MSDGRHVAALVEDIRPVAQVDVRKFDAIVVAGGRAQMFTFETAVDRYPKVVGFNERGKTAAALCHGVAELRYVRRSNGEQLARGRTVTGFASVEEACADHGVWDMNLLPRGRHVMPWHIEDEMSMVGANLVQAGL